MSVSISWLFMKTFNHSTKSVLLFKTVFSFHRSRESAVLTSASANGQEDRRAVFRFRIWRGNFFLSQLSGYVVHPVSHLTCAVKALSAGIKWLVCEDAHPFPSQVAKAELPLKQVTETQRGSSYSSTLSLTSALDWGVWLTFWRRIFLQILAHPVFKMWVIQKPNKVALWNKRHFEEKKWRLYSMLKIFSTYICWINIKWGI